MERAFAVVVTLVCLCSSMAGQAQPRVPPAPVRDTSAPLPASAGLASVHGRVTSAATGHGLRDAIVTLRPARGSGERGGPMSVRADADGRFTLRDVPAGEYDVTAQKPGYVAQGLGQASSLTPARQLRLGPRANAGPLNFALAPGGVVTGRVLDEHGEPVERVQVQALKLRRFGSEWRLIPYGEMGMTDDLGAYRIHSLPAGRYVMSARPVRQPRFSHPDARPEEEPDFVPTYAPNAIAPTDATRLMVGTGLEHEADIVLGTAQLARVDGRVIDAQGAPAAEGTVMLVARGPVRSNPVMRGPIHADGTFTFADVPPGAYTVTAQHRPAGASASNTPAFLQRHDGGWVDIDVDGSDMADVAVRTSAGASLRGRVVVDGDAATLAGRDVRVTASPTSTLPIGGFAQARVSRDGSFTLDGVHGPVVLRLTGVPAGWWTRTVTLGGRDVTEGLPIASTRPVDGVELVVSTRPIAIRGTVTRPPGTADDAVVVVFLADAGAWEESPRAAGIALGRPVEDGSFSVTGVRPGRYHVVAVHAPVIGDDISDPDFLRLLAGKAQTVEVTEAQSPPVVLTVVEP